MKMGLKIFCFFILSIFACSKVNQWKQPTEVCFGIALTDQALLDGAFTFKEGYLTVSSFEFDGKRAEGADVYFTKHYAENLNAPLGGQNLTDLSFDVPQGVYTEINLNVISKNTQTPNLVINGIYVNSLGDEQNVRFELNELETFLISGKDLLRTDRSVDLMERTKTKATILLDPSRWFASIDAEKLEKAQRVRIEDKKTILINTITNEQLYKNVVAELGKEKQEAIFVKQS